MTDLWRRVGRGSLNYLLHTAGPQIANLLCPVDVNVIC